MIDVTIGELKERLEELHEENEDGVDDGCNLRVFMPGGEQLDVLAVSVHDVAGPDKGEKFIGLRLDTPTSA